MIENVAMKKNILTLALFVAAAASISAAEAKENWEKHCQKCHGADGKGQTKMGRQSGVKDYTDSKVQAELKDENAIKIIIKLSCRKDVSASGQAVSLGESRPRLTESAWPRRKQARAAPTQV